MHVVSLLLDCSSQSKVIVTITLFIIYDMFSEIVGQPIHTPYNELVKISIFQHIINSIDFCFCTVEFSFITQIP